MSPEGCYVPQRRIARKLRDNFVAAAKRAQRQASAALADDLTTTSAAAESGAGLKMAFAICSGVQWQVLFQQESSL